MTKSASSFNTVEPWIFEETSEMMFATHDVIDVLPLQLVHILVTNFSKKPMKQCNHMGVMYATRSLASVMTGASTAFHQSPIERSKSV